MRYLLHNLVKYPLFGDKTSEQLPSFTMPFPFCLHLPFSAYFPIHPHLYGLTLYYISNYTHSHPHLTMREKCNKQDFELSNKNRIKIQKKQRNGPLRTNKPPPKSLVQSPQNSDDDEYQSKLLNRGSQWWAKVDHRFFRALPKEQLQSLMERTTSDELLDLRHPSPEVKDYFSQRITAKNPYLGSPCFLRVLFRREVKLDREERYQLVTYSIKEYDYLREPTGRIIVGDRTLHLSSFRYPKVERMPDPAPEGLGRLELDIIDVEDCQEEVRKLLQYDVVNAGEGEALDKEIALWEMELRTVNQGNVDNWREMIKRMHSANSASSTLYNAHGQDDPSLSPAALEQLEISQIKKQLRMTEVLLYFQRGHSDKTQRMLEDAMELAVIKQLSLNQSQRKKRATTKLEKMQGLFETDCKICFCTQSDDRNKVVYCDACNTSFHQACYGVESIDQTEKFYCQVCAYVRAYALNPPAPLERDANGNIIPPKALKKPSCLLCCKPHFPMRQFSGHFYHVTCLVLFDMVQIKDYRIEFRQGLTPNAIFSRIIQNEIQGKYCSFCHRQTGMKFPCILGPPCGAYFHPICAYLNGVHFSLIRSYRSLQASLTCPHHLPQRDSLNQVYLRRFFCDYKGTSNKTDLQFQAEYEKELQEKASVLQGKMKETGQGVMRKGKIAKSYKCNQPRSRMEGGNGIKRQGAEGRLLPPSSLNAIPSQSMSLGMGGSDGDMTETRKLLRMMSARNESS